MNKETYEALKRILSNRYGKNSLQWQSDTKRLNDWVNEVAKEYEEKENWFDKGKREVETLLDKI